MKKENKDLICGICNLVIDKTKDYVRNTHFKKENEVQSEGHYHTQCFRDRLSGGQNLNILQRKADKILDAIGLKVGAFE